MFIKPSTLQFTRPLLNTGGYPIDPADLTYRVVVNDIPDVATKAATLILGDTYSVELASSLPDVAGIHGVSLFAVTAAGENQSVEISVNVVDTDAFPPGFPSDLVPVA